MLDRAWVEPLGRCVSVWQEWKAWICSSFLCLLHQGLGCFDSLLCLPFALWIPWWRCLVLKFQFMTKRFELRSIVWGVHIQNTIACEVGFKLVYDSTRCSVWQCINFPESRVIIQLKRSVPIFTHGLLGTWWECSVSFACLLSKEW